MTPEERARLTELLGIEARTDDEEAELSRLSTQALAALPATETPAAEPETIGAMRSEDFAKLLGTAVAGALKPLDDAPSRTTRPVLADRVPAGSAGRTTPGWADSQRYEQLYRKHPNLRNIRTADTDHVTFEWVRMMIQGDREGLARHAQENADYFVEAREVQQSRILATTSALSAGNLVPDPLSSTIATLEADIAVIGPRARQESNDAGRIGINTKGVQMAVDGKLENAAATETTTTYPKVDLKTATVAGFVESSRENDEDSAFSIVGALSQDASEAYAEFDDRNDLASTVYGQGTNASPLIAGITTNTAAVGGPVTEDVISEMFSEVKQATRNNGVWLGSNVMRGLLVAAKYAVSGFPLLQSAGTAGALGDVDSVMGKPFLEVADDSGLLDDTLIFGNLGRGFAQLTKGGMIVETSIEPIENFSRKWAFFKRRDSSILYELAFSSRTTIA